MKFGGSSLKDPERIRNVAAIVQKEEETGPVAVVLSAMQGITDSLIGAAKSAEAGDPSYRSNLSDMRERVLKTATELVGRGEVTESLEVMLDELEEILHGIELVRECSPRSLDLVQSFGERMNCTVVAALLSAEGSPAVMTDARELVRTDDNHLSANVDFEITYRQIEEKLGSYEAAGEIPVITGFIGSTNEGVTTTLGRNGSDYSASIMGAGLRAEAIEIWTDVDGVMSADPRIVPNAFVVPEVSFEEAMELSYFGAKVIHPYTMIPAVDRTIPVWIRNTLNPEAPGTRIAKDAAKSEKPITGIASIDGAALINVQGGGMVGMPGVASKVFSIMAECKANIIMISQASSEHSICMVLRESETERALHALREGLREEVRAKKIQNFELIRDLEIVSIIGDKMRGTPGISGRLFKSLGDNEINVLAIAQGSSERNISFVVQTAQREDTLKTVHQAFLE